MNYYERLLFNGRCPYTDFTCDKNIECYECPVEDEEWKFAREIWEDKEGNEEIKK